MSTRMHSLDWTVIAVYTLGVVAIGVAASFRRRKGTEGGQVVSRIAVLDQAQRIEEVARMLGGVTITGTTRQHAAEMLGITAA